MAWGIRVGRVVGPLGETLQQPLKRLLSAAACFRSCIGEGCHPGLGRRIKGHKTAGRRGLPLLGTSAHQMKMKQDRMPVPAASCTASWKLGDSSHARSASSGGCGRHGWKGAALGRAALRVACLRAPGASAALSTTTSSARGPSLLISGPIGLQQRAYNIQGRLQDWIDHRIQPIQTGGDESVRYFSVAFHSTSIIDRSIWLTSSCITGARAPVSLRNSPSTL
jgi:hypothetical protein